MRVIFATFLLILCGCAPSLNGANSKGGMITHTIGLTQDVAFKLADEHCKTFNKSVLITQFDILSGTLIF